MFLPFEDLPSESRVWIYQAENPINPEEQLKLEKSLKSFVEEWTSHGASMKGSVKIMYSRFIIIACDEKFANASGCSIDKLVNKINEVGTSLNINLIDRNIAYLEEETIKTAHLKNFKHLISESVIKPSTLIFQNNISQKVQLTKDWIIPAEKSWVAKYFS